MRHGEDPEAREQKVERVGRGVAQRPREGEDASEDGAPSEDKLDGVLPSLSSSGPLSSSARVAILAALLAFKRTTFTELLLAVNVPKSSLNLSLTILKDSKFVTVRKGFLGMGGPRTIVEMTPEGEKAIGDHLVLMQNLANRLLPSENDGAPAKNPV